MADAVVVSPHEPDEEAEDHLALHRPDVPVTLSQLAALKGEAQEIIEARIQVLTTLRVASIRATHPEDWVLFRDPHGGQVIGYLQDAGCDRVRDLFGIEVFDVSRPEKVNGVEPGVFHYLVSGSGRCKLTRQVVETIEGGRSSTDDFAKGKTGVELDLLVRKAARANLDGNITRELAGMKSVPDTELRAAWTGTNKRVEDCRLGRGFGTAAERRGAEVRKDSQPTGEAPTCSACGTRLTYQPAGTSSNGRKYDAFWSCPKRRDHPKDETTIKDAEWQKQLAARSAPAPAAPATPPTSAPPSAPMTASDIPFAREPGQDG